MQQLFDRLFKKLDPGRLRRHTEKLWLAERTQTTPAQREAALVAEHLLKEAGLSKVTRHTHPADGKTACQDKTMPLAWDATVGRLEVLKSPTGFDDPVVADFTRHPFHLVGGSVSTPRGGTVARLITEEQMLGPGDPAGCVVVLDPFTRPRAEVLRAVMDLGLLGFVAEDLKGKYRTPDAHAWFNAVTEGNSWHVTAEDRNFIGFSVSPRTADALRQAARAGETVVRVTSDGRRYIDEIDTVTGVLPGESEAEVWLMAHLYEPMSDDNSAGVVAAIEAARTIKAMVERGTLPAPRFTLRLVFAMEMYGFAAFAEEQYGGVLRDKVLGAYNLDGSRQDKVRHVWLSPAGSPTYGDYVMERLVDAADGRAGLRLQLEEHGAYADDQFLADATTGLPTIFPLPKGDLWHSSAQTMDWLNVGLLRADAALAATWASCMLTMDQPAAREELASAVQLGCRHIADEAQRAVTGAPQSVSVERAFELRIRRETDRLKTFEAVLDSEAVAAAIDEVSGQAHRTMQRVTERLKSIEDPEPVRSASEGAALRFAETVIPKRLTRGLPHDLARVDKSRRRPLPDRAIYGPFAQVLSGMDGKKTLRRLIEDAGWHYGVDARPRAAEYAGAVNFLARCGYLECDYGSTVTKDDIVEALHAAGVAAGDVAMVHSAMSPLGYVEGGPDAVIDALLEVLGAEGTLLMPSFTRSFAGFAGQPGSGRIECRPHSADSPIWVGAVPRRFVRREGVVRSRHVSHSVAGVGKHAEALLVEQEEDDPPTGRTSAFAKLADIDATIVFLGADVSSNTYLHHLEDDLDLDYLYGAACKVRRDDGSVETVWTPRHLPGHRDFYRRPGEDAKVYRRLLADGLEIRSAPVGFGHVKAMSVRQLDELGRAALDEDPNLLLCDSATCVFCASHKV